MGPVTFILLGGYGNTGSALVPLLLEHTSVSLVLAGRDGGKARRAAEGWNARFPGARCRGQAADARDAASLRRAFEGADLVVVASSTSAAVETVAQAALASGLDYLDPNYSTRKLRLLREMAPAIEAAGRCFITDGGFHPGLPALLIRFAASRFDQLCSARVGSVIQIDWRGLEFAPETVEELVAEFRDFQMLDYRGGAWRKPGWLAWFFPTWMTFGHGFGRRYTVPMFLEELRPLPEMFPGLESAGFFVAGFNWFVDWFLMPVGMALLWLWPRRGAKPFGSMLLWGLRRFSRPPFGTLLQLEALGTRDGKPLRLVVSLAHADGYVMTAAPMAACLMQWMDGSVRRPGLHFQALLAEPGRMLRDLERMGIEVSVRETAGEPRTGASRRIM
ncbi:MAG: saccharopine dehydrogenase NADP-binding domain-containing protein [Chloroflexota bacterium]